ncbi:unnamed protein product [Sphenostylis stenocarpa]|uniref:BHLH domain-containing protein n=1 Tax=Sphenostylis stenocarpa TaxID=92480 RepID=A0AA86V973_9FABA|nr:unnamed protein product [Sphenostylis stenocarpa]
MSSSSYSTKDQISLALRHILLRSSLTAHEGNHARNPMSMSTPMLGFCTSKTAQQKALRDGISDYKGSSAANVSSSSVAVNTENGTDDCHCESEVLLREGETLVEEVRVTPKCFRSGSSSKRSRAAEVHNLSEKRRRSRINEKLKALQNLIPNSNKTDKASMLDEAIEYLKQLQLQVQPPPHHPKPTRPTPLPSPLPHPNLQDPAPHPNPPDDLRVGPLAVTEAGASCATWPDCWMRFIFGFLLPWKLRWRERSSEFKMLSMRNGLSWHPMFLPEGLQPPQLSQMRMDSSEENRSIPSNTTATLPMHQENPMHYSSNLPNKHTVADQPSMSTPAYVFNSETSFRLESPIPENIRSFQLRSFSEQICREDILRHQHLSANHSDTNPLGCSQVKDNIILENCIPGSDRSGVVLRNSEPNTILTQRLSGWETMLESNTPQVSGSSSTAPSSKAKAKVIGSAFDKSSTQATEFRYLIGF